MTVMMEEMNDDTWEVSPVIPCRGLLLVLECSTAAGSADELLQHVSVQLPEGRRLGHLRQVVHTELEAELLQVLHIEVHTNISIYASTQPPT